jgi:hypothetical protein
VDVGRVTPGRGDNPAFIIGCPRSGTSILGEAIAKHPRVAYLFEDTSISRVIQEGRPDHRLTRADANPELLDAFRRAMLDAASGLEGDVLVEKNPRHVIRIPFIAAAFPGARFIHIIRDGRDVTASLMFRNRGPRWGHVEIPGWREVLASHPDANHIRSAIQWRDTVRIARDDARELPPGSWMEIRYEDLLREPARIVGEALAFIGLDLHPEVQAFLPRIQDSTAGSYHARKQVRHYVDDHSRRVGRHRENLSAAQLAEVEAVCGPMLRELGYV